MNLNQVNVIILIFLSACVQVPFPFSFRLFLQGIGHFEDPVTLTLSEDVYKSVTVNISVCVCVRFSVRLSCVLVFWLKLTDF